MHKFINQYYQNEGKLYRKSDNKEVGWVCGTGYLKFDHCGKKYLVHRAIFLLENGYLPDMVDHIDRDKTNNKPDNLRPTNKSLNSINTGLRSDNTSGIKGISKNHRGKWHVYLDKDRVRYSPGTFSCLGLAIKARRELEETHHV